MNIYFCGIGGVGLGPLAEIALDAGHTVQGSDPDESLMTRRLTERGIAVNNKQKGMFLQATHNHRPIDWFVYSSAVPDDHPELVLAKMLGIKTSKRDELLRLIIDEKKLRLIAVSGTHGKTTTAAMMVWVFQQLGIPISYSVGTTMSFGPSGHYDPASQYFVYECDEFDRNFLEFHPFLSLITSVDYDHPDTYGSPEEYIAAFRQFTHQSEMNILWQSDGNLLGETRNAWVIKDDDVLDVELPGLHYRRNASLVVKAMERLQIPGNVAEAINHFPGTDRRFEKLGTNLYSDYGHHPTEIAAMLQLASEITDDIVLVYQPHQNLRQHELRTQYTDCFGPANEIYWLPTYLTREDPALAILSPEELTEDIINREAIHLAQMNNALWENIQRARDRGALVLVMGAGSIDGWVRKCWNTQHVINILMMDREGNFILRHGSSGKDDSIDDLKKISAFGDVAETKDPSLRNVAFSQLQKATNIQFTEDELSYFKIFQTTADNNTPAFVICYALTGVDTSGLEIHEDKDYIKISPNELSNYPLTIFARSLIAEYTHPSMTD